MSTIYYKGYHASVGTTSVNQFWGDIHVLTFRSDKVISDRSVLADVVARFEEEAEAFDRTLYNSHAENIKANRSYGSIVEEEKSLEKLVFEYQGKTYSTLTSKHSVVRKIQKEADKILEHKQVWMDCLVYDATCEIVGKGSIKHELDLLLFEDCI